MDINTLRGLSTLLLLVAFIGLVVWVYSGRRKKQFEDAAQLPFADEELHRRTVEQSLREQQQSADREKTPGERS
jgi:cbb3-type cytochrome oxidase subunit 3